LAKQRLECPEQIEEELAGLRKDFLLNDKCKMLVLVSMATDGMIRLVSMYPEVWCIDTTAGEYEFILNMYLYFLWLTIHMHFYSPGVNWHNKELFLIPVRTPCGKTFPGNFTIILSSKK
jgi:hypothetical protein